MLWQSIGANVIKLFTFVIYELSYLLEYAGNVCQGQTP